MSGRAAQLGRRFALVELEASDAAPDTAVSADGAVTVGTSSPTARRLADARGERTKVVTELLVGRGGGGRRGTDQVVAGHEGRASRFRGDESPEPPAHPVPHHGTADRTTDGVRDTRRRRRRVVHPGTPEHTMPETPSLGPEAVKYCTLPDPTGQADSRSRPFARRDFKMARPARVLIRWRKPWRFERRRLLGW